MENLGLVANQGFLALLYYPGFADVYINMFLACFGGYGEPKTWWEYLAGMRATYPPRHMNSTNQQNNEESYDDGDDTDDDKPTNENLLYGWTLQLLLGLCGVSAQASVEETDIRLQCAEAHVIISSHSVRIINMR